MLLESYRWDTSCGSEVQLYQYCCTVLPTYSNGHCNQAPGESWTVECLFAPKCLTGAQLQLFSKSILMFVAVCLPPHSQQSVVNHAVRVVAQV